MSAVSSDDVHFKENFVKQKNSTYNSTIHLNLPLNLILVTHSSYCAILTENTYFWSDFILLLAATIFQTLQTGTIVTELLFVRDHLILTAIKFDRLFLNNLLYFISQALPPKKPYMFSSYTKKLQLMKLPRVFQKFYKNSVGPLTPNNIIIITCL